MVKASKDRRPNSAFRLTRSDLEAVEAGLQSDQTHGEIAATLDLTRPRVSNLARLLALPRPVLDAVRRGALAPKTAEALLPLRSEALILEAFRHVTAHGLSAAKARERVKASGKGPANADTAALERAMSEALGAPVTIESSGKGFVITIRAADLDCVDGVVDRLGIEL